LVAKAEKPGMRRWSLRSLAKRKIKMQKKRPIVEMLRRYWMFPYHGSGITVSPPEGGGDRG
jgi:hypothetical protein